MDDPDIDTTSGGARSDEAQDPWRSAPSLWAWVPLADLLPKVEHSFGISPSSAADRLRLPIERGQIPSRAMLAHDVERQDGEGLWLLSYKRGSYLSVRDLGNWGSVDWTNGIIDRHPIEVRWLEVQEECRRHLASMGACPADPPQHALGPPASDGAGGEVAAEARHPAPRRDKKRGPPRNDYREADEAFAPEIDGMVADGRARSVRHAAQILATDDARRPQGEKRIEGGGEVSSKIRRLVRAYYKWKARGAQKP